MFSLTDYLIDNSIAMIFISIISYQMFRINDSALRLAGEEMEKNRELAQNLEELVHDRTEELQEANEKLKEMDRIKSDFFANISHEIRTPLTMILAPVESALQGDQGVAIDRTLLMTVERNAARLLKLVNNLLDLARLDAGRMPMARGGIGHSRFYQVVHRFRPLRLRNAAPGAPGELVPGLHHALL